ncbi:hypothetical protein BS17DRAFT_791165 [Gyrodon lividus]|nr:hypothetical protein BS17DRAFT_791165 [Gyrodon lividus]
MKVFATLLTATLTLLAFRPVTGNPLLSSRQSDSACEPNHPEGDSCPSTSYGAYFCSANCYDIVRPSSLFTSIHRRPSVCTHVC